MLCSSLLTNIVIADLDQNNKDIVSTENDYKISTSGVPKGFENLAGPQFNQIDVYYQGTYLVSTEATYDFETLTFHKPEQVIEQIHDLLDAEFITKQITQPLANNSEKLCLTSNNDIECGTLSPPVVGVIFDEGRFRVDLFINAQYLQTQYIGSSKYLPAAKQELSTIHNLNLNLSGTDNIDDSFNIQTNSIVSYGEARFLAQSNYTDEEDFVIDEISIQKDNQGWEAELGVFESESRSTDFFSQMDITGLRAKTSLNTRTDIKNNNATNIFIFLNARSRVEIFRDNRLIDSRFYDAGNRQLDTSRFPDGAYQISVRIREENGTERTEEYFFVRNFLLPPDDEPILYAEAGKINKAEQDKLLPESSNTSIVHIGGAFRVNENSAIEGEILSTNKQHMVQTGVVHVASGLQSQVNIMATTENDWGISIRENYANDNFSIGLDYRHVSQGDDDISDADDFDLVARDTTQASASIVHELFDGRIFWRYRLLDLSDSEKSETYSVNYRKRLLRKKYYQLDWEFGATKDTDDYLVNSQLKLSFRKNNNSYRLSNGIQTARTNDSYNDDIVGSARWLNSRVDPRFGKLQSQLYFIKESNFDTAGVNVASESRYGFNEIELNKTNNHGQSNIGYSLRSQLSVASDFNSASMGGAQRNNSAIIINLNGKSVGEKFEVLVDRQSVGFAEVGKSTIIPLAAYETYDIRLESRSDKFLSFDEKPKEITLYPGNVSSLNWQVSRKLVLIGKIIDIKGNPIKNARINNVGAFAGTDDRGWFQIESAETESLELQLLNGNICRVDLGAYNNQEDVHVFDELICNEITTSLSES